MALSAVSFQQPRLIGWASSQSDLGSGEGVGGRSVLELVGWLEGAELVGLV